MNDPTVTPVDILEQKNWLKDFRSQTGASWSELGKRIGIPQSTLAAFGSEKGYGGPEQPLADKIFRYRQLLVTQASIEVEAPETPGYFETPTSKQLNQVLAYGQRGKIVLAAMGPGTGKTMTAKHFAACYANVFVATMAPSTAGVNTMQIEVLEALGEKNPVGTPQKLSRRIRELLDGLGKPMLIIDEAQHLSEKSIEEIRSWHDAVGCGIALFGNVGVLQRLEGGNRASAFAQLYSRVSLKVVRPLPLIADIDALAEAWGMFDEPVTIYLHKIGMLPGGLRGLTMTLELASMLAAADRKVLALDHIKDAWAQLSSRTVSM